MSPSPQRLLLVTGTGRSGTSTLAGALERLGLHVPEPRVPADESNPRGFYEPQWVVDLHKEVLNRVPARTNDARPSALAEVTAEVERSGVGERVHAWLGEQVALAGGRDIVVKDPRTMWFTAAWTEAAHAHGLEVGFLTMLRHPVDVSRSRDTHYLADRDEDFRVKRQTANVASWVHAAVVTEQVTRDSPRAFVRYTDLLADWRSAVDRLASQLDLALPPGPEPGETHPVDEFIEPSLNRSRVSWDDVPVHPALRVLATEAWEALETLVEAPADAAAAERLAQVGREYAALHDLAEAVALDHTNVSVQVARREQRVQLRRRWEAERERDRPAPAATRPLLRRAAGRVRRALTRG